MAYSLVCNYSGGMSSYIAAKRAVAERGKDGAVLLFADTQKEETDLYKFLVQGAAIIGVPLLAVHRPGGMDQLIRDKRAIPNNRMPFCSSELKVKPCEDWIKANAPEATRVFGITWEEVHRIPLIRKRAAGREVLFPLAGRPFMRKDEIEAEVVADGLTVPSLYPDGFMHGNCGGGCVRGGIAAWLHTLIYRPLVYAEWEYKEERNNAIPGRPKIYSILVDRRGGSKRPMTLRELRERHEAGLIDQATLEGCHGGCGCFSDENDSESVTISQGGSLDR